MVKSCVAVGCKNREDRRRDLNFYRIPRDSKRRPRLTAAIRRENWAPNDYHRLCSSHFISGAVSHYGWKGAMDIIEVENAVRQAKKT
ncbi:THAP domain-containing protein 1-like [Corythoichthys intestinalis]|uniref:THAP domain-containing protein 1-like n=1 Tax=Corythoichthys intestinalis TaxID=161448 RepID=UPI0025A61660|nr:THAP domain-containing protein 1-like [Corythoichthys intestinalis]